MEGGAYRVWKGYGEDEDRLRGRQKGWEAGRQGVKG